MAKKYRMERVLLDENWNELIESSDDGTVFMTSEYLEKVGCRLGLYHCFNNTELRAAIALVESEDSTSAILDDLIIYSGICFGPTTNEQGRSQKFSERFEITSFIATELACRYESLAFSLAPSISDIRPFQWYRYGEKSCRYEISVRYTTYIEITDFFVASSLDENKLYQQATGSRRQQIRYARRDGIKTHQYEKTDKLIDFYRKTMERQGEKVTTNKLGRMEHLVSQLQKQGLARQFVSKTAEGIIACISLFVYDQKRAYYLFGGSDPSLRNTPAGTAVLWDAFTELSKEGINEVDLEGVNSPKRGWFKLSFGGDLKTYYEINLNT